MIEKRLVQWYAADAGVDLDIAEREIVLAYVLHILLEQGLLNHLAFKGGTAMRKLFLGNTGRFSLDLDFTNISDLEPDTLVLELVSSLHGQTHYGLVFSVPSSDYYAAQDSCGAEVTYRHSWTAASRFSIQISFRAKPLLPVRPMPLRRERYFDWMEIQPPVVPALDLHEVLGEKVRATLQRTRVRDLYDLYLLAVQPYSRELVRQIAVMKCWETRFAFDPGPFLAALPSGKHDWSDLSHLVRRDQLSTSDTVIQVVQQSYAFLEQMTPEERVLASDAYGRHVKLYEQLANALLLSGEGP